MVRSQGRAFPSHRGARRRQIALPRSVIREYHPGLRRESLVRVRTSTSEGNESGLDNRETLIKASRSLPSAIPLLARSIVHQFQGCVWQFRRRNQLKKLRGRESDSLIEIPAWITRHYGAKKRTTPLNEFTSSAYVRRSDECTRKLDSVFLMIRTNPYDRTII